MYDCHDTPPSLIPSIAEWRSSWLEKGAASLWGTSVAFQRLRRALIELFESDAVVYRISASSKPVRDVKGDQSLLGLEGGGVGGVPGGRKVPSRQQGLPGRG